MYKWKNGQPRDTDNVAHKTENEYGKNKTNKNYKKNQKTKQKKPKKTPTET